MARAVLRYGRDDLATLVLTGTRRSMTAERKTQSEIIEGGGDY